jgi:hypothetical protein
MPWKNDTGFNKVDDLFKYLLDMYKKDKLVACRGQSDSHWLLQTSLDRILDPNADYAVRLSEESAVLEKFRVLAREYVDSLEEMYLYGGHANDKISALSLLQHYRAPTRLLDWTRSPWVALYFAAIAHHDKPGAVWWFNQRSFEQEVGRRWRKEHYDMERYRRSGPNGQIDLNATAFNTDGPLWITMLFYKFPFHRIEVQQGFFTVAGSLGFEHGELIADVFDRRTAPDEVGQTENQYTRIIVPALWKQEILDRLRNMNIHSKSLDYPGADIIGSNLAQDLKRSHRCVPLNTTS